MADAPMTNAPAAVVQPDLSPLAVGGVQAVPYTQPSAPAPDASANAPLTPYQQVVSNPAGGQLPNAPNSTTESTTTSMKPAAPVNAGGHTKLLAMVQGLSDGLAGFSAGLASKGRVSGAEVVQNLEAQRQQAQQAKQAAATAQMTADTENKYKQAMTNQLNSSTIHSNQTFKNDMAKSDMSVQEEATKLAGDQFNLFAGTGMNPAQISQLVKGGQVDAKTSNMLQVNAQQQYRIASQLLPDDNPTVVAMKGALADPNTSPATLVQLNNRLQAELKGQEGVNDAKIKAATVAATAPFGDKAVDLNKALLDRYKISHPGATELPQGYALDANSTSKDFDRVDKIMQQTETALATKANRDVVNGMREQMLDLAKGAVTPGDETKSGEEYIATLPVGLQGTIKEIGTGRAAPPPAGSRSPAAQTINAALNRAYPDYDATKYPAYLKARISFTSGPEAKGINALNTVETHLSRMLAHANAPNTSGGITGKVTGFFGDKDVQALDVDRTAVSTELSKAYAAGQISEGEVKDWESKLDITRPGMTTGKLATNIKEIDGLLEGKQKAYQTQWAAASPSASIVSPVPIISSDAAAARANIRGEKASAHNVGDSVTLKNGQTVVIKTMNPDGTFTY